MIRESREVNLAHWAPHHYWAYYLRWGADCNRKVKPIISLRNLRRQGNEGLVVSKELTTVLQRIVKGSGLVFIGTLVALVLNFFSRVILARAFTVSEYGVFNLAMVLLSLLVLFALMGIPRLHSE